jgi:lysozyme family protein
LTALAVDLKISPQETFPALTPPPCRLTLAGMEQNTPTYFDEVFAKLIDNEGGYVNDPRDAGGETKYGISKRAYPLLDIAALTLDQARAIYYRDYWVRMHADGLPAHVVMQVFDGAVNSGIENSLRWLQKSVGVPEDGKIGKVTLAAINAMREDVLIRRYIGTRLEFLTQLSTWQIFGKGWAVRIANQLKDAV